MVKRYKILVFGPKYSGKTQLISCLRDTLKLNYYKNALKIYNETTIMYKNNMFLFIEINDILPKLSIKYFDLCLIVVNNYDLSNPTRIITIFKISKNIFIPKILIITKCELMMNDYINKKKLSNKKKIMINNYLCKEYFNMFDEILHVAFAMTERKELKEVYKEIRRQSSIKIWNAISDNI